MLHALRARVILKLRLNGNETSSAAVQLPQDPRTLTLAPRFPIARTGVKSCVSTAFQAATWTRAVHAGSLGIAPLLPTWRQPPAASSSTERLSPTRAMSRTRLLFGAQLLEALAHYMLVDLPGREITVPEKHLHHAQICAVVEQVRGESMA